MSRPEAMYIAVNVTFVVQQQFDEVRDPYQT